MTTGTLTGNESFRRSEVERRDTTVRLRLGRVGLGTAGVVAVLASAWGGIVPYVGPTFGFSADGSGSWYWNLAHSLLALVPGVVGILLGLFVIAESRGVTVGRGRLSLAMAGTLLILCGAWFAIGPYAWPVLTNSGTYVTASTHMRVLTYELGYSVGVGLVLVMCGAFVAGWASRHSPNSAVVPGSAPAAASPAAAPPARAADTRAADTTTPAAPAESAPTTATRAADARAADTTADTATGVPDSATRAADTVPEPEAGI